MFGTVLDDFNRSDGAIGANYTFADTGGSDNAVVSSNQLTFNTTNYGAYFRNVTTYGPDCEAFITFVSDGGAGANSSLGLFLRGANPSSPDGYYIEWYPNGSTIDIYIVSGGSFGSPVKSIARSYSAGYKLGVQIIGNVIHVYTDEGSGWVERDSYTDGSDTYPDAGYIGFQLYNGISNSVLGDDFGGGDVGNSISVSDSVGVAESKGVVLPSGVTLGVSITPETIRVQGVKVVG